MDERLLTIKDIAKWLQVAESTAYLIVAQEDSPRCIQVRGKRRWFADDWLQWAMRKRKDNARNAPLDCK